MFSVCGRQVKVVTRTKSQTVNICTSVGQDGVYDYVIRFRQPRFVSESELSRRRFASLDDFVAHLQDDYGGDLEKAPGNPFAKPISTLRASGTQQASLSEWERAARSAIEQAIDQLILEFVRYPYLHRREHSIHCRLYELMSAHEALRGKLEFAHWVTQPIQKEWPEFIPRPGNRRGAFDLVVLSPEAARGFPLVQFLEGRIRPSIVIEMGLDYPYSHLADDIHKLRNSAIADSYLVHLVRQHVTDNFDAVERLLLECEFKSAYVRHMGTRVRYKVTTSPGIQEVDAHTVE